MAVDNFVDNIVDIPLKTLISLVWNYFIKIIAEHQQIRSKYHQLNSNPLNTGIERCLQFNYIKKL